MKRTLSIVPILIFAAMATAQESTSTTATTMSSGGNNLNSDLWFMDDAVTLDTGQVDLRFTFGWSTSSFPANLGDGDDDFTFTPSLYWGTCANVEVFATVPIGIGDGGDVGAVDRGNADTNLGFTYRISDGSDGMMAQAIKVTARVPTGDNSSGVDGEFRLIMTNDYDSGIRSHINLFAQTLNGNNGRASDNSRGLGLGLFRKDRDLRDFGYGAVIGMDGPLCNDGTVRWVADYMHRSGQHNGSTNSNVLEAGWEWTMSDSEKLGMSVQVGLDDNEDTLNLGASISYSHSLTF